MADGDDDLHVALRCHAGGSGSAQQYSSLQGPPHDPYTGRHVVLLMTHCQAGRVRFMTPAHAGRVRLMTLSGRALTTPL